MDRRGLYCQFCRPEHIRDGKREREDTTLQPSRICPDGHVTVRAPMLVRLDMRHISMPEAWAARQCTCASVQVGQDDKACQIGALYLRQRPKRHLPIVAEWFSV
jgi:hypothetical protein